MANISEEKWIEMLEKKSDGSYIAKYPKVKSKSGVTFDEHLADYTQLKGDLSTLKTTAKDSIPNIVNELFTNVSNGKQLVGGAITDVDDSIVIPTDPTFQDLANAIGEISTGKKWAIGTGGLVNDNPPYLAIRGLGFQPSMVVVSFTGVGLDIWSTNRFYVLINTTITKRTFPLGFVFDAANKMYQYYNNGIQIANFYLDGFDIQVSLGSPHHTWVAYE